MGVSHLLVTGLCHASTSFLCPVFDIVSWSSTFDGNIIRSIVTPAIPRMLPMKRFRGNAAPKDAYPAPPPPPLPLAAAAAALWRKSRIPLSLISKSYLRRSLSLPIIAYASDIRLNLSAVDEFFDPATSGWVCMHTVCNTIDDVRSILATKIYYTD